LYAKNGQHIIVLKHFVDVSCGWYKQFEVAVSLNHSTTTLYHHFDSTNDPEPPKFETSRVGITV